MHRPAEGPVRLPVLVQPEVVVDVEAALTSDVALYDGVPGNVVVDSVAFGMPDVTGDDFFAGCEVVVSGSLVNQRVAPCPMEPRSAAAVWVDGRLHQWLSSQNAHRGKERVAQINGADPDFHRRDMWDAITAGNGPEWDLGVQLFDDEFADSFEFDVLDSTKLIPEEQIPVRIIGRLVLNENVDNFFAETEQVAFCTQNVVPGIDFTRRGSQHTWRSFSSASRITIWLRATPLRSISSRTLRSIARRTVSYRSRCGPLKLPLTGNVRVMSDA